MLLSVRDLNVRFNTEDGVVYAVNGVSFDTAAGESIAIVGESGCGKSVTGLAIIGLLPRGSVQALEGHIEFDGKDLLQLPEPAMRRLRGRDIAMVFQDPMTSLNPVLTIGRQLTEALTAHQSMTPRDAVARAKELLDMVGISEPAHTMRRYPHQLSGGMRQRVMIAMALALEPKLLIADEPTTALDVTTQAQVLELVRELRQRIDTALILITHDLGVVASMTERVSVMYAGMIVESTTTTTIFETPRHPYTVGLLHSVPRLDVSRDELVPIEGRPPDQHAEPAGCPFAPRCAWRLQRCWTDMPELVDDGDDGIEHLLACHNPVTAEEAASGHPMRAAAEGPAATPLAVDREASQP